MKTKKGKNPLIILISLFVLVVVISYGYSLFFQDDIKPEKIVYDANGEVIDTAPFPPSLRHPLGTDRAGNDMLLRIIEGAKYTVLIVVGVAVIRFLVSLFISYLLVFPLRKIRGLILSFLLPFQYVPSFILVIVLSIGLLSPNAQLSFWELIFYQFMVILLVGIPILVNVLTDEMRNVLGSDFIEASYLLGATNFHVFIKQMIPVLYNRMSVLFLQQLSSALLLLIHLGVFQYFIGGKREGRVSGEGEEAKYLSESGEWAGMIGQSIDDFLSAPWIFFGPLTVATLFLLVLSFLSGEKTNASR
jgi:peptide/nickel transport system permease protein